VLPGDPLAYVLGIATGEILLHRLLGKAKGIRALRRLWRTQLELDTAEALCAVLRPLRIVTDYPVLERLKAQLSTDLVALGLTPYPRWAADDEVR